MLETAEPFAIFGKIGTQKLERHFALQPRVFRQIDLAHSPGADLRNNFVIAQRLSPDELRLIIGQEMSGDFTDRGFKETPRTLARYY